MSTCNISIQFSGNAETIITKAKSAVERQNGNFIGDANSGNFELSAFGNSIKGNYNIAGQMLNLTITDKPFLIPCSTIESFLKSKIT